MVAELKELLGKEVVVKLDGLLVFCRVEDAREVWGKVQVLVSPMAGAGKTWKNFEPSSVQER